MVSHAFSAPSLCVFIWFFLLCLLCLFSYVDFKLSEFTRTIRAGENSSRADLYTRVSAADADFGPNHNPVRFDAADRRVFVFFSVVRFEVVSQRE